MAAHRRNDTTGTNATIHAIDRERHNDTAIGEAVNLRLNCVWYIAASTDVPAASDDPDVDPRLSAALLTLAGAGLARRLLVLAAEHRRQQRALLHPLCRQPRPVRLRARTQGNLQQVSTLSPSLSPSSPLYHSSYCLFVLYY